MFGAPHHAETCPFSEHHPIMSADDWRLGVAFTRAPVALPSWCARAYTSASDARFVGHVRHVQCWSRVESVGRLVFSFFSLPFVMLEAGREMGSMSEQRVRVTCDREISRSHIPRPETRKKGAPGSPLFRGAHTDNTQQHTHRCLSACFPYLDCYPRRRKVIHTPAFPTCLMSVHSTFNQTSPFSTLLGKGRLEVRY